MSLSVSLLVARTEVRRTLRVFVGNRTKVALMAVVALFGFGPITVLGLLVLPSAGEAVAAGAVSDVPGTTLREGVTGATAVGWLVTTAMATVRTVTTRGDVDEPACVLVSTSTRSVVVGLIVTEVALFAAWLAPLTILLAGAFAYGAGSVVPLVVALALLTLLVLTAVPTGFVAGIWIRHLLTSVEPIARLRTPLLFLAGAAYVATIATGLFDRLVATLFRLLANSPFGWPGELLLLVVPTTSPSGIALAGTALVIAFGVPLALAAGVASAKIHWYADAVRPGDGARDVRSSKRLDGVLAGFSVDRATGTIAVTAIRRTKRAPVRLLYVAYPLFGLLGFGETLISTGRVTPAVAFALCAYVVWGAGALFTLNVLGDHGRALPAILTTPVSGRQAIGGTILAGALVAVPVAILVGTVVGLASPLSLRSTALLVAGTVFGAVTTPALATGVGALFPRFGSVRVTSNREAVMPSKTAFVTYTFAIAAPGAAAVVLYSDGAAATVAAVVSALVSVVLVDLTVDAGDLTAVAWVVLALGVAAPPAAVWYATHRFDRLVLD